jgi:mycothiol synthase
VLRIEPVDGKDRSRALRLLVGGADADERAAAFESLLTRPGYGRTAVWWARTLRGPRAAAAVVPSAGRCAMLFHSAPRDGRSDVKILARLIAGITEAALGEGLAFVQTAVAPLASMTVEALQAGGYEHLAELIYLRCRLQDLPDETGLLDWEEFEPGQEDRLGRIIANTYVGSADCPGLLGLRGMDDVLASHKASGVFCPQTWWIPTREGEPVGCVLVNDAAGEPGVSDVVYLGTRPKWRRQGLARAMLRHALIEAARRDRTTICLAVDAANAPAIGLYLGEGLIETERRDVFIRPAARPKG